MLCRGLRFARAQSLSKINLCVVALSPMTYTPMPIETSAISLPEELKALSEKLAENAHDLWAAQRFGEGWSYGPERDDKRKHHPCLVPYDQLPDSEKEYDRLAALGTLKAILKLGYRILSPPTN
jgi:RyR domain